MDPRKHVSIISLGRGTTSISTDLFSFALCTLFLEFARSIRQLISQPFPPHLVHHSPSWP